MMSYFFLGSYSQLCLLLVMSEHVTKYTSALLFFLEEQLRKKNHIAFSLLCKDFTYPFFCLAKVHVNSFTWFKWWPGYLTSWNELPLTKTFLFFLHALPLLYAFVQQPSLFSLSLYQSYYFKSVVDELIENGIDPNV